MPQRYVRYLLALVVGTLVALPVEASNPGPPDVTSLFVPIEGDVAEPGTNNVVHLTGEVHMVTRAVFDAETNQWGFALYADLVRVRGTSAASGITYLGVGAGNVSWVSSTPGPPDGEASLTFALLGLGTPGPPDQPPGPPDLPVFFRDFVFAQEGGHEGHLLSVATSFD